MTTAQKVDPLLERAIVSLNRIVADTWRIGRLVSQGTFGIVYELASETRTDRQLAIKVGKRRMEGARCSDIEWEAYVLRYQEGNVHCPKMYGFQAGDKNVEYIIMDLLGQSLSMIHKRHGYAPLETGKAANIGNQCIEALRSLHATGFIHRDIKPGNVALGLNDRSNVIHIIDFGLARRIRYKDGSLFPPRSRVGFCGTLHYASRRALANKDQSMADDLESLFYMLCELVCGKLPWPKAISQKEALLYKQASYCNGIVLPSGARWLRSFGEHVLPLQYFDEPKYHLLQKVCVEKMQEEILNGSDALALNPMFGSNDQ
uniref:Protein kinase domain-containing protein n=1 Tax=Trichuris muris TaxID=70415 RepID=A0A5S6R4F5_TRIMR